MDSVAEKWTTKVNTVTIGATKDQGGTRSSTVTVGGSSTLPYLNFEGEWPNPPAIAIEILDVAPEDWPEPLVDAYGDVFGDPAAWAKRAVDNGAEAFVGNVDDADATKLAGLWGSSVTMGDFFQGDFDGDGIVGPGDAAIMVANWGYGLPGESQSAVPEPSMLVLLLGMLCSILTRRGKR